MGAAASLGCDKAAAVEDRGSGEVQVRMLAASRGCWEHVSCMWHPRNALAGWAPMPWVFRSGAKIHTDAQATSLLTTKLRHKPTLPAGAKASTETTASTSADTGH